MTSGKRGFFSAKLLIALLFAIAFAGCFKDPIGTPCVRKGDGFTARHNCETKCLSIWKIKCPSGEYGNSNVCAGREGCERGSCAKGEVCYQTNMDRAYCVPESICPEWSDPSKHPAVELRQLKSRRSSNVTAPAVAATAEPLDN